MQSEYTCVIRKGNTAFTLALRTVPARFGLSQHGYDRECKRVITVPCRAGPARVYTRTRGLARYGTVVAASVNANRASNRAGERFSVSTASLVTSISPCYCSIALVLTLAQSSYILSLLYRILLISS